MNALVKVTLVGTIAGVLGTGMGGLLIALLGRPRRRTLSFLLTFSGGIMVAVVFNDLIPEALELGNGISTGIGIILGIFGLYLLNRFIPHFHSPPDQLKDGDHNLTTGLVRAGLLLGLGIAMHNFPEGLAIGAGYAASEVLGFGLAIALGLHNIPEGMAMAAPLLAGGVPRSEVIFWSALAGLPMGFGALIGAAFGGLSAPFLSIVLSFAAGAMVFLVFHELLPEAHKLKEMRSAIIGFIVGILLGLFSLLLA